jgi:hypothetical protein
MLGIALAYQPSFSYLRNILGEDLGPLSIKELDQIENQIDVSLKHIMSRKVRNFTGYGS